LEHMDKMDPNRGLSSREIPASKTLKLYYVYNYTDNITNESGSMRAKVRRWGNSLGIVIPKEVVEASGIRPGDEVSAEIRKISNVAEIFGSLRGWRKSAQEIKNEARRGWS